MSPTILRLQYTVDLTKCDGIKSFIAPNMIDIATYIDHHRKEVSTYKICIIYLYIYIDMIGYTTNFNYSGHNHHSIHIKTNTDSVYLHPVLLDMGGGKGRLWVLLMAKTQVWIFHNHRWKLLTSGYPYII